MSFTSTEDTPAGYTHPSLSILPPKTKVLSHQLCWWHEATLRSESWNWYSFKELQRKKLPDSSHSVATKVAPVVHVEQPNRTGHGNMSTWETKKKKQTMILIPTLCETRLWDEWQQTAQTHQNPSNKEKSQLLSLDLQSKQRTSARWMHWYPTKLASKIPCGSC